MLKVFYSPHYKRYNSILKNVKICICANLLIIIPILNSEVGEHEEGINRGVIM